MTIPGFFFSKDFNTAEISTLLRFQHCVIFVLDSSTLRCFRLGETFLPSQAKQISPIGMTVMVVVLGGIALGMLDHEVGMIVLIYLSGWWLTYLPEKD